jgi:hypothetical protein
MAWRKVRLQSERGDVAVNKQAQKSEYVKPALMPIGSLVATTAAGSLGDAETNCFFRVSLSGGMMAGNMTKQVRC